jgi:L-galactonate dehydratase
MCLEIYAKRVVDKSMHQLTRDMGKTWRYMVADSQYRWIGPEKSVTHLAVAGILNAVWDLWGKILRKPVWRIVADMSPEEFVRCIDFRYVTDVITPEEGIQMLEKVQDGKQKRIEEALRNEAVPVSSNCSLLIQILTGTGVHNLSGLACIQRREDEEDPAANDR